ncbi:MAG: preprotein translocase subunit YajC [Acidimicrobiales bacterium]|jgi:preprotein translocase subunit YajC|nr:preprotein translocase subunit YajC [Acidimicrobiales bacterium]
MSTILLVLLFVLAWVVLILPKQRELKRHNALLATLEEGDEVMSGSGIYGTITAIEGDVVHLEVAPGIELRVARRAVASKVPPAFDDATGDGELDELDENDDAIGDGSDDRSDEVGELEPGDRGGAEAESSPGDAGPAERA